MHIILKCGEIYEFYKIKWIKLIEAEIYIVKANFKQRGNYKETQIRIETIQNKKHITNFLNKHSKQIKSYEGLCPHCNSEMIAEFGYSKHILPLNDNKNKKPKYEKVNFIKYYCLACKKDFKELKECYIDIYYM